MNPKSPAEVIDAATARKNSKALAEHQPIPLDINGSVAKVITMGASQALGQVLQNSGGLVAAFLEGKGHLKPEEWKIHVKSMEFDEAAQSLRITGLELRPVK